MRRQDFNCGQCAAFDLNGECRRKSPPFEKWVDYPVVTKDFWCLEGWLLHLQLKEIEEQYYRARRSLTVLGVPFDGQWHGMWLVSGFYVLPDFLWCDTAEGQIPEVWIVETAQGDTPDEYDTDYFQFRWFPIDRPGDIPEEARYWGANIDKVGNRWHLYSRSTEKGN
jgi:hypothetical protein